MNEMSSKEYFAITDVHGCFLTLMSLLEAMGVSDGDVLINCGDVVDRGPRIKECLDFFKTRENVINILGNHDKALLDYAVYGFNDNARNMWGQGLKETVEQLGDNVDDYAKFIATWEKFVRLSEFPDYVFCHSSYPWKPDEEGIFTENHLWERWFYRYDSDYEHYDGPIIIHGHTPTNNDIYEHNSSGKLLGINLDGGAVYKGPSSCLRGLRLSDRKIFEAPNLD